MIIVLNEIPPSVNKYNGRENTHAYRNEKKRWGRLIRFSAPRLKKPAEYAEIILWYYFKDRRRHDPDNYAGKFIHDGLKDAGIIIEDDFEHILSKPMLGGYDKKNPRVEIEIEVLTKDEFLSRRQRKPRT